MITIKRIVKDREVPVDSDKKLVLDKDVVKSNKIEVLEGNTITINKKGRFVWYSPNTTK